MPPEESRTSVASRHVPLGAFLLVGLGLLVRFIFLESDPVYDQWPGFVTDEGLWNELARHWVLFGQLELGPLRLMHLVIAPVYQAMTAVSFFVFGVSFSSARLVSGLCGCGILIGAVLLYRRRLSTAALLFAGLALAIQPDLVVFSRLAIPETPALLFGFLAFSLIVSPNKSTGHALGAGLLTAIALGVKATSAPIVPIFALVLATADRKDAGRSRLLRLAAYTGGVGVPALVVVGTAMLFLGGGAGDGAGLATAITQIARFVRINDPYSALTILSLQSYSPALNVLLLPVWTMAGILLVFGRKLSSADWTLYVGSAIWTLGLVLAATVLAYFPERYILHVVVPIALNIGAGFTLLQKLGDEPITGSVTFPGPGSRLITGAWWALPFGIIAASVLLGGVSGPLQLSADRFSVQVATILLCEGALVGGLLGRERLSPVVRSTVLVAPLVFAPLFLVGIEAGLVGGFWTSTPSDTLVKVVLLVFSLTAAASVSRNPVRYPVGWAYVAPVALLWLTQVGQMFITPTYTLRDTSTLIAELAEGVAEVGNVNAGSLFLGNTLRYRETPPEALGGEAAPEVVVVFQPTSPLPLAAYETLAASELELGVPFRPVDPWVRVYRRRGPVDSAGR